MVLIVFAIAALGLVALDGGLRIRTPIDEMTSALDRPTIPSDLRAVSTESSGSRVCLAACDSFRVDRLLDVGEPDFFGSDDPRLCDELLVVVRDWFGQEPRGAAAQTDTKREFYARRFWVERLAETSRGSD